MNKYQVYQHQSLLDIAIQLTGKPENAFWIAQINEMSMSDELVPGIVLEIPLSIINNIQILKYYNINELIPATSLTLLDKDIIDGCEGIGCWEIELDFIAS